MQIHCLTVTKHIRRKIVGHSLNVGHLDKPSPQAQHQVRQSSFYVITDIH